MEGKLGYPSGRMDKQNVEDTHNMNCGAIRVCRLNDSLQCKLTLNNGQWKLHKKIVLCM